MSSRLSIYLPPSAHTDNITRWICKNHQATDRSRVGLLFYKDHYHLYQKDEDDTVRPVSFDNNTPHQASRPI